MFLLLILIITFSECCDSDIPILVDFILFIIIILYILYLLFINHNSSVNNISDNNIEFIIINNDNIQ